MPSEIDILGRSCDVVRHGRLLKIASIRSLLNVLTSRGLVRLSRRTKKPVLCLSAVTDEEGHTLENEDESGTRLCEYWGSILQARVEGPRHHQYEDILRYVQKAPDDIRWTINRTEF